jgi:hypothetical protein
LEAELLCHSDQLSLGQSKPAPHAVSAAARNDHHRKSTRGVLYVSIGHDGVAQIEGVCATKRTPRAWAAFLSVGVLYRPQWLHVDVTVLERCTFHDAVAISANAEEESSFDELRCDTAKKRTQRPLARGRVVCCEHA